MSAGWPETSTFVTFSPAGQSDRINLCVRLPRCSCSRASSWAGLSGITPNNKPRSCAEYLSEPVSYDDTVAVGFSATGFLNRSVRVAAFNLGDEDPTTEDVWADRIARGDAAKDFYRMGFRRVIASGSNVSREIVVAPERSTMQQKGSGELSARSIE